MILCAFALRALLALALGVSSRWLAPGDGVGGGGISAAGGDPTGISGTVVVVACCGSLEACEHSCSSPLCPLPSSAAAAGAVDAAASPALHPLVAFARLCDSSRDSRTTFGELNGFLLLRGVSYPAAAPSILSVEGEVSVVPIIGPSLSGDGSSCGSCPSAAPKNLAPTRCH